MVQRHEAAFKLLVSHQQLAKLVEPTVCHLTRRQNSSVNSQDFAFTIFAPDAVLAHGNQLSFIYGYVSAANGVHDPVLLSRDEARALESHLECVAAIHSPSTGIVDSHALMLTLQGDF